MSAFRQLRLDLPHPARKPTADDRRTMRLLEALARGHAECWSHTKTIAAKLGIGVRAVQVRLRRLVDLGLLDICRDYTRRARRRLVLLWAGRVDSEGGAERKLCAHSAQRFALTTVVPPHPPIEVSEDNSEEGECDDTLNPESFPAGPAELPPPPPDLDLRTTDPEPEPEPIPTAVEPPQRPQGEPKRLLRVATSAEVQRLHRAAAKAVPGDPTFPRWVTRLAKTWGLSWVLPAAELTAEKSTYDDIRNPKGFVLGVLKTFEADGGPPPIGPDPEAEAAYWRARLLEGL